MSELKVAVASHKTVAILLYHIFHLFRRHVQSESIFSLTFVFKMRPDMGSRPVVFIGFLAY